MLQHGLQVFGIYLLHTLTASDLPVTPSTAQTGDASKLIHLFKIGSALTQGHNVIIYERWFNMGNESSAMSGLDADVTWKVWHRSNSSSAWAAMLI